MEREMEREREIEIDGKREMEREMERDGERERERARESSNMYRCTSSGSGKHLEHLLHQLLLGGASPAARRRGGVLRDHAPSGGQRGRGEGGRGHAGDPTWRQAVNRYTTLQYDQVLRLCILCVFLGGH